MSDSYELVDGQVIPYRGGRRSINTDTWRDATDFELYLQSELADRQSLIYELQDALRELVYERNDRYYVSMYGDTDVTDIVGSLLKENN